MKGKIEKVVLTKADGFIPVYTPNMIYRFEGWECCPKRVSEWVKKNPDKYEETLYLTQFQI